MLAGLTRAYQDRTGCSVAIESVGGVEAAARVQDGEPFDVVLLAREAIDRFLAAGHVVARSAVDLVRSGVAVAVRRGGPRPDIDTEENLRRAVLAARTIGCSTGPSGVALVRLFDRWGIAERIRDRVVTPPPGTPVGALVARGEVELGFQQRSELIHVEGIDILGPLPPPIQGDLFRDFPTLRFVIPHGGGAVPYHWGRYRGLAQELKKPPLGEHLLRNVFFDTCVYHQPGIDLLMRVMPIDNILFASEMIGAVRGIDPETSHHYDDTRRYVDATPAQRGENAAQQERPERVLPQLAEFGEPVEPQLRRGRCRD